MTILLTQTKYLVAEWDDMRMLGIGGQLLILFCETKVIVRKIFAVTEQP